MRITTTHVIPSATFGGPDVTVTLEFAGFMRDGNALAARDTVVSYTVTDGTHTIGGSDMRTAPGWNDVAESLCRALCTFLTSEVEHAEAHDRMSAYMADGTGVCREYGHACPAVDAERIAALSAMNETLSLAELCAEYPSEGAELVSLVAA